ncbi:AP2/ERF domain [Dillenia turbinata]|uniref:AP2/ERF domain n=1 Tax=Dillenia turbinata TaxID=194707 RepID=A0AAN8UG18_9MAGN
MAKISQEREKISESSSTSGITPPATSAKSNKPKRTRKSAPRDSPPQRAYDDEEAAAHAYDLAALKYWGQDTILNFPLSTYENELKQMEDQTKEEYIGSLRRKSSGFSRGVSKYRGVARHHHNGRWEARIGRVFGNKYLYLGTYATQEEAATAYDMAAIEYRGLNAVTNFDLSRYIKWLKPNSNLDFHSPSPNSNTATQMTFSEDHNASSGGGTDNNNIVGQPWPGGRGTGDRAGTTASSALGLLFQSTKFKEMLERTSVADCPSTPMLESVEDQPRSSVFPDDIQTYFGCNTQDFEGDDIIFGGLNSFALPIFQCDMDL